MSNGYFSNKPISIRIRQHKFRHVFFRRSLQGFAVILLLLFFILSSSCTSLSSSRRSSANTKMPRFSDNEFKVSVETDGKKVNNPESRLIQRIRIRESDVVSVFGTGANPRVPSLNVKRVFDSRGSAIGLEIVQLTPLAKSMGLQIGDILTAVGKIKLKREQDLVNFGKLFSGEPELSFTYERNGNPHKTIFFKTN
ncbi:MAG TPA: hypothetical protein PKA63_10545 [Oligoflexia bacterium]|nr:hypothetical protein [Oligoflexia bacterium]HMP49096.1 hypothetical protein [Oligoflexia bacterium]